MTTPAARGPRRRIVLSELAEENRLRRCALTAQRTQRERPA
jgi:hypothetical protein